MIEYNDEISRQIWIGMDEKMTAEEQCCEVPLIEQLRSVPKDYRTNYAIQWDEEGRETGHRFIPVGFMMHRAADELEVATKATAARDVEICMNRSIGVTGERWDEAQRCAAAIKREHGLE